MDVKVTIRNATVADVVVNGERMLSITTERGQTILVSESSVEVMESVARYW